MMRCDLDPSLRPRNVCFPNQAFHGRKWMNEWFDFVLSLSQSITPLALLSSVCCQALHITSYFFSPTSRENFSASYRTRTEFPSTKMPAAPELIETDPSNILLAVDVPESACPGSTFHVELKNRFFEVNSYRSIYSRIYVDSCRSCRWSVWNVHLGRIMTLVMDY